MVKGAFLVKKKEGVAKWPSIYLVGVLALLFGDFPTLSTV